MAAKEKPCIGRGKMKDADVETSFVYEGETGFWMCDLQKLPH